MHSHYDARRDAQGWTVFDRWTGEIVVLRRAHLAGLTWGDAEELVDRLNRRRTEGDRSILQ